MVLLVIFVLEDSAVFLLEVSNTLQTMLDDFDCILIDHYYLVLSHLSDSL